MNNTREKIREIEKSISSQKKELAALRQQVEPEEIQNYNFLDWDGNQTSLRDCFDDKQELILVYNMGKSCKYCTLWGDNFNGIVKPLNDKSAFVVVSPDAPEIQYEFANSRNWKFKMLSHKGSSFIKDMKMVHGEKDSPMPGVSSFVLKDDKIYHYNQSFFGPGDNYCNMWDFIDLLPSGVGGWSPKYEYES